MLAHVTPLCAQIERERRKTGDQDIALMPREGDLLCWDAVVHGPPDTPYAGGVFRLSMKVPTEYPIAPPLVSFITPIFHPNVHWKTGEICLDILKTAWSPAWTLQSVCRAITALMSCPEGDSPLNCDAGNLVRAGDLRGFACMASMYTRKYATGRGR